MKFLVDECVGAGIYQWLRVQGYDTVAIIEVSPGISDTEVLALAQQEKRILVTMDKDFGELVFRDNATHSGIILLRLKGWPLERRVSAIAGVLASYANELEDNFIVVTAQNVRIIRR